MREVFEAHEPRIRAFARSVLGNAEDAEEVAVATFLRFWRTAGRFRGDCTLKAYLTRIGLNLARDRIRKRRPPLVGSAGATKRDARIDDIHEAMGRLEPADREILALYYLEETSYEELMETLELKYDVVRTRLVRARQRLRKIMEEPNGRA